MNIEDEDYNSQIVEDRTTLFVAALQADQGFSNSEIAFGCVSALVNWMNATNGQGRSAVLGYLDQIVAELRLNDPEELQLGLIVDVATMREQRREQERG